MRLLQLLLLLIFGYTILEVGSYGGLLVLKKTKGIECSTIRKVNQNQKSILTKLVEGNAQYATL